MATIGMKYPVAAKRTVAEGGEVSYTEGMVLAHAINGNITVTNNSAQLYGDDAKQDEDTATEGGTVSLGTTDLNYKAQALLLGHSSKTETLEEDVLMELTANVSDQAGEVGYGYYTRAKYYDNEAKKLQNGFRAIWIRRAKFTEPSEEAATLAGSPAYNTPTITGSFFADEDGNWKDEAMTSTEAAARKWLENKAGIAAAMAASAQTEPEQDPSEQPQDQQVQ